MKKKKHLLFLLLCSFFSLFSVNALNDNYEEDAFDASEKEYTSSETYYPSTDYLLENRISPLEDIFLSDSFILRAKPGQGGNPVGVTPIQGKELFTFSILALLYTIVICWKKIYLKKTKQ